MNPAKRRMRSRGADDTAKSEPLLGCIADDITGASDLADALVGAGLATVQLFGVPQPGDKLPSGYDAVVVALKSRTCPVGDAVTQTVDTARWLLAHGVQHTFFKYCSTFDSTPAGNIGPVTDALVDLHKSDAPVVHCPAYPVNQRTQYQGHLFVGRNLLSESGMRDHPLTPMRDANLVRVLAKQTPTRVSLVPLVTVREGINTIRNCVHDLGVSGVRHVLADALIDDDITSTAKAVRDAPVAAGGAAFGAAWGAVIASKQIGLHQFKPTAPTGYEAVLAGSASSATAAQIAAFQTRWPVFKLDVATIAKGVAGIESILAWAEQRLRYGPVLIAADTSSRAIEEARARFGIEQASQVVENTLALLAVGLMKLNVRRLVVAGGETSGAVSSALGLTYVQVGPQICPGVPWTISVKPPLAVAFKSGNFGSQDFFADAFESFETDQWRHE